MKNSLFRGGYEDFSIQFCQNCGAYMHIRLRVTICGEKFKVCSDKCEKELRAKKEKSAEAKDHEFEK